MNSYKIIKKQIYTCGEYSIVPLRMQDRFEIMKWRNEQMYHLRQNEPLTKEKQDNYFEMVVNQLFDQEKPAQLLFSYLKGKECIGYGGLVHINWVDKNAEISFLMETALEKQQFEFHWKKFLFLIENIAFIELQFHKIYTYAFDIRKHLYPVLENGGFKLEADLKEHCYFKEKFISVKIHSKIYRSVQLRNAEESDFEITYRWANDVRIRAFSYNQNKIPRKEHSKWFYSKLQSMKCEYYILTFEGISAGSVRFDFEGETVAKINYLIDPAYTGKGLGTLILQKSLKYLQMNRPMIQTVYGYVFPNNTASIRIFEKLSFEKISLNNKEIKFEKKLK